MQFAIKFSACDKVPLIYCNLVLNNCLCYLCNYVIVYRLKF